MVDQSDIKATRHSVECVYFSEEGHFQAAVEEWELTRCIEDIQKVTKIIRLTLP